MGRRIRRAVRRVTRGVERVVRRVVRESENVLRDTGTIVGDMVTGGSFTQKELAEQQAKAEKEAAEKQAAAEQAARDQEKAAYDAEQKRIADQERYQKQLEEERQNVASDNVNQDTTGVGVGDVEVSFRDTLKNKKRKSNESSLKKVLMS